MLMIYHDYHDNPLYDLVYTQKLSNVIKLYGQFDIWRDLLLYFLTPFGCETVLLVNILCTRQVLLNIAPKLNENPSARSHMKAWRKM